MRIMSRAWRLAAVVAASLVVSNGALLAGDAPVVRVKATVGQDAVRLDAQANGPFQYTSYRASKSLYVLDLSGVSPADAGGARVVPSELVKGYRETAYSVGQKPMVRLEVLLAEGIQPRVERTDSDKLSLVVSRAADPASSDSGAPALKPASAVTPAPAVETNSQRSIQEVVLGQKGNATQVSVVGSAFLTYHTMHLSNPDRVVLDFDASHLRTSVKHIPSNLDPVRDVRVAQFTPEISRVVIDLREAAAYNITRNGSEVTVAFAPGAAKPAPVETPDVSVAKAVAPVPASEKPAVSAPLPAPEALLPAALTRSSSGLAAPVPAKAQQQQDTAPQQTAAPATPAASDAAVPSNPVPAAAAPMPAPPAAAPAKPADYSAPGLQSSPRYTGEPISVNLKNVDLQDFFRLIHEISGLNVVVDPTVKGSLTIVLDNVPWDQALDIVLRNNDLEKQLDGNVLRIATRDTVKKEAEEQRDLSKAQAEAADVVTTTRVLSYAKAADMATMLKKFLTPRGEILSDDRSNTLVISDVPSVFPTIDNLLRQLDRKSRQVEIEARVVAANRSFDQEFGTQLAAALGAGHSVLGGGLGPSPITHFPAPPLCNDKCTPATGTTPSSGQMPLLTDLGTGSPTSAFSYIFQNGNFALDEIISAAEERGVGKLLSKPTIFTQNNEKGTVKQGTKIPVQTIINNTVSVQFVDAVLQLDVTPQITADGTIYMDVTIENDQIDQSIPRVEGIPAIDTQAAQTRVTVKDGATVVVGGIMVSQQRTDVQDVPVLGSVPIIGNLFKHKTVSSNEQELLFFLTPRILPG